ncbi:hypothetical protein [Komagataeibacter diospyri]|nr:hypothetical protein [Komagataeibacter diospyri]
MMSGFDVVEYMDFRINEARMLPDQVEDIIRNSTSGRKIPCDYIAFLTAVPVTTSLSISSPNMHKQRLLEHEIWNDYVPDGIPDGMMVYHWKKLPPNESNSVDDFITFIKLQTRFTDSITLIKYLIFAFLFGIAGNLCASVVQYCFTTYMWPAR